LIAQPQRRFYFFLARELGKTVDELLRSLSSRELTEWAAYYRLERGMTESEVDAESKLHNFFGRAPS
jgi:hypothetical protein